MSEAHSTDVSSSIRFEDWRGPIQMATDLDDLMHLVQDYLVGWRPEQLQALPAELRVTRLVDSEDVVARAVVATREELRSRDGDPVHDLLKEMALTMAAAAMRLRYLKARLACL